MLVIRVHLSVRLVVDEDVIAVRGLLRAGGVYPYTGTHASHCISTV
jgi:hypothetical protein